MINYIKTDNPGLGEIDLSRELSSLLNEDKKVLWIISGGSNISIEATIMRQLDQNKTKNLKIILGDERYGQKNHKDSNEKQLEDKGFIPGNAEFIPILIEKSVEETVSNFGQNIDKLTLWADYVIGQFGIGDDGHTSGVLPNSSGVTAGGNVVSYRGPDFLRITMTLHAIEKINKAYVFCYGQNKLSALNNLRNKTNDISNLPCLVFYKIPEVYVYNDLMGNEK
jgi:6-phosphogluconolactonase/glucosamine-6-phosphate isomerase/deaminase